MVALNLEAQQKLSYAYDSAGNRTSRTIFLGTRSADADVNQLDSIFFGEALAERKIKIYPNPVQYELTIFIDGYKPSMQGSLALFNLGGNMVLKRKLAGETTHVNMSIFPKGTYILNIHLEGQPTSWKIIKQ
ncbi:MAG: T9SS type A sorting domain-containing protein [Fermentimonas sp.]